MIKVVIADDHSLVLEGLRRIITEQKDMQVVGVIMDGRELITLCKQQAPDVLLLDVSMPGPGFLDTIKRLKRELSIRILMLSMHSEEQYAIRSIKAGASGYMTKERSGEDLAQAIRHIHSGRTYVSEALGEQLIEKLQQDNDITLHDQLSDREYHVLCLLGAGKRISDIATDISLSPKTVSTYRARIFKKMGFANIAELVRYVSEHELGF